MNTQGGQKGRPLRSCASCPFEGIQLAGMGDNQACPAPAPVPVVLTSTTCIISLMVLPRPPTSLKVMPVEPSRRALPLLCANSMACMRQKGG